MSYKLTLTDGTALATVADGAADLTTTSINLIGKNYAGYGLLLNENFIQMLEHFSSGVAPANPLAGQLWWDKQNNRMNVYVKSTSYTGWKVVSSSQTGPSGPTSGQIGDLWWNTTTSQLSVYSGPTAGWVVIGPVTSLGTGVNLLIGDNKQDILTATHTVGNLLINNKLTAVYSSDSVPFTPTANISGLTVINPGINFTSTAELGMVSSPNFRLGVYSGNININSLGTGNGVNISVKTNSGTIKSLLIDGSTGLAKVAGNPVDNLGISTKAYTDSAITLANLSMKSYVDAGNSIQAASITSTVSAANVALQSYVDARFTALNANGIVQSVSISGGSTGLTTSGGPIDKNNPSGTITIAGSLGAGSGGTGITSYNIGDIVYATGSTTLNKLGIGQSGNILVSSGTAPQWLFANTISVKGATNISGGASGSIPYQSGPNTTAFLSGGTAGMFLTTNGTGAPYWSSPASAVTTISDDTSTNATHYPLFVGSTNTTTTTEKTSSTKLYFNPNTGLLTATTYAGSGSGLTNLPAGSLTGTIPSSVLQNSTMYIGTTGIQLNRASGAQSLTGVSIDGAAGSTNTSSNLTGGTQYAIPYQSAIGVTAFLAAGTSGKALITSGTGSAPIFGTLGITGGGTNNSSLGAIGAVAYSDGTKYAFTANSGSAGQVLTSQGLGVPPQWSSVAASGGTVTSVGISVPGFLTATGPITTSGTISIGYSGTALPVAHGGTGSVTLDGAGIVTKGDTQTISGSKTFSGPVTVSGTLSLTTPLSVVNGGTGTNSATGSGSLVLRSSPALTGVPTAPTAVVGTNTTQLATTEFVQQATISGIGYGQTWQSVTSSRIVGVTYYNTTGKPILVIIGGYAASGGGYAIITVNGIATQFGGGNSSNINQCATVIVPPGGSYVFTRVSWNIINWNELR